MQVSDGAYRWALGIYLALGAYVWYIFHSLGLFLAQHYVPENPVGFSTANPNISVLNNSVATALTLVCIVFLFSYQKLKEFIVDVGDELTRVSWARTNETYRATLVVLGLVISSGIFFFIIDMLMMKVINAILATAA